MKTKPTRASIMTAAHRLLVASYLLAHANMPFPIKPILVNPPRPA
jgi:hypothetical protein